MAFKKYTARLIIVLSLGVVALACTAQDDEGAFEADQRVAAQDDDGTDSGVEAATGIAWDDDSQGCRKDGV